MAVATRGSSVTPSPSGASAFDATNRLWKTTTLLYHHKIYRTAIEFTKTLVLGTTDTLSRSILTMNVGIMFTQLDEHEQAEHCFEEAAVMRPELCIARFLLGTAAYKRKQFKKAEIAFKDCRLLFPKGCQSIDYGDIGLEYVLRLDLVIMDEVYSTWEWCQPQMAFRLKNLPPHPLYTLGDELIFHPPRSLFVGPNDKIMPEDLRSPPEKDSKPRDQLSKEASGTPVLHSSKNLNSTLSRSKSMQLARLLPSTRPGSVIKSRSVDNFRNVTNTPSRIGRDTIARARALPRSSGAAQKPPLLNLQETTEYSSIKPHVGQQPIATTEPTQKPGAEIIPVQNTHCTCHSREPPTGTDIVHLKSRFSARSVSKSHSDWSSTFGALGKRRLPKRTLKEMVSRVFTRDRPALVLEPDSGETIIISTPVGVRKTEDLGSSCPTAARACEEGKEVSTLKKCAGVRSRMVAREARVVDRACSKELLKTLALDPLAVNSDTVASEKHAPRNTAFVCSRYEDLAMDSYELGCDIPVMYVAPEKCQDAVYDSQDPIRSHRGEMFDNDEKKPQSLSVPRRSQTNKPLPTTPNEDSPINLGSDNSILLDRSKDSDDSSSWYETLRILCGNAKVDSTYDQAELQQHREYCCYHTNDDSILQDQHLVPSRPAPPPPSFPVKTPSLQCKPSVWSRGHVAALPSHHTRPSSDDHSPSTDTSFTASPNTPLRSRFSPSYSVYSLDSSPALWRKDSLLRHSPRDFDEVLDTVDEEALELVPDALRVLSKEPSRVRRLVAKFEE